MEVEDTVTLSNGESFYLMSKTQYDNSDYFLSVKEEENGEFDLHELYIFRYNKADHSFTIVRDPQLILKLTPILQEAIEA